MLILLRALGQRLTFANGMSSLAVFLALGGTAYAATALPANSVGTEQIQARAVSGSRLAPNAVSGAKVADGSLVGDDLAPRSVSGTALGGGSVDTTQLAPGSVTLNRLSDGVQRRILQPLRGEAGPQGPAGPAGPAGPGAARFRYSAPADGAPAQTVVDIPSFRLRAACDQTPDGTAIIISVTPGEDTMISETVTVDQGADIASRGGAVFSGNLAIPLPGGVETVLGGPATQTGYARAVAALVIPFSQRTVSAQVVTVADASTGRCSIDGTAVIAG